MDSLLVTTTLKSVEELNFKLMIFCNEILSEMGLYQMRTLFIDARVTLSSVIRKPSVFVQPSNLFSSSHLLSLPAPTSSLTPKMDRVFFIAPSTKAVIFTRPLIILEI